MKSLLTALLVLVLAGRAFAAPEGIPETSSAASKAAPDSVQGELLKRSLRAGDCTYTTGIRFIQSGLVLVPLGFIALIPVMEDGAFGITAADPGIGGTILAVGGALIHIGIPIMGSGAGRMEKAAQGLSPGFEGKGPGWNEYRWGWRLVFMGGGLVLLGLPIAAAAALDWSDSNQPIDYVGPGMVFSGLGAMGVGALTQYYAGYGFMKRRGEAAGVARGISLSLSPMLRPGRDGSLSAGLRLSAGF